jgi:hypothetical protein
MTSFKEILRKQRLKFKDILSYVTFYIFTNSGTWVQLLISHCFDMFAYTDTNIIWTCKTDRHDITEILLKVVFNTITLTIYYELINPYCISVSTKKSLRYQKISTSGNKRKPLTCHMSDELYHIMLYRVRLV